MMRLSSELLVPAGLVVLSLVPVLAGMARLAQMAGGVVTPENARFVLQPLPGGLHIVAVTLFSLLGALQFAPSLRRRLPLWHRRAGRVVVPAGLVAALTGLWLNQYTDLPPMDGVALYLTRLVVGLWMTFALCRGYWAIRHRDVATHRNWMLRGYAIGLGAGTQVLTHLPWFILIGPPDMRTRAVLMGLGWATNALVAEVIIARRGRMLLAPA